MAHLSGVNGVVHDLDPALECGHLEEAQVRLSHMIKVHPRILPRVVFRNASIHIGDDLVAQRRLVHVDALGGEGGMVNIKQRGPRRYFSGALTLKYFPANSWTPMMAKISQKIRHTSSTLKMDGMACTKAFTTTCIFHQNQLVWKSQETPKKRFYQ